MHALRLPRELADADTLFARLPEGERFWLDGSAMQAEMLPEMLPEMQPETRPESQSDLHAKLRPQVHPEGRWSFVGARPAAVRRVAFGEADPWGWLDVLASPNDAIAGDQGAPRTSEVPWWVGYIAYDAAWSSPSRLGLRAPRRLPRSELPILWMGRFESLFAIDHVRGGGFVLAPSKQECDREIASLVERREPQARAGPLQIDPPDQHRRAILRALEAIAAGEIYQVNLARRFRAAYEGSTLPLWRRMRAASPVPLGLYLEAIDHAVLARTMERFLRWEKDSRTIVTCPIKGTIARAGDDAREHASLRADDKERAEHSMIVDLMRNDLSRIAELGTVEVENALRVEPFAKLSHLVSTVRARTKNGVGLGAILDATFPPGSITGTPKLRAMELIEELEPHARGVYTGTVGYVDRAGGLSLAVAIRTAVVHENEATYFAGGGLVSASDPDREIAETDLKARVFLDALEEM
ncbi:MAG: anthranilate synthase component I family protein [Sandaracinaceae bacterium]|nr:anthranilate synthase component I family protein [Sandaracinaceae bacterium]